MTPGKHRLPPSPGRCIASAGLPGRVLIYSTGRTYGGNAPPWGGASTCPASFWCLNDPRQAFTPSREVYCLCGSSRPSILDLEDLLRQYTSLGGSLCLPVVVLAPKAAMVELRQNTGGSDKEGLQSQRSAVCKLIA